MRTFTWDVYILLLLFSRGKTSTQQTTATEDTACLMTTGFAAASMSSTLINGNTFPT